VEEIRRDMVTDSRIKGEGAKTRIKGEMEKGQGGVGQRQG
jgi:hypothetical protein